MFFLLHMSTRLFTTGMNEDDLFSHIISFASLFDIGSILDVHDYNLDRHLLLEETAESEGKCSMRQRIICMTQSLLKDVELIPSL
jgi:hypothetical protein